MKPSPLVGAVAVCCTLVLGGCGEAPTSDARVASSSAAAQRTLDAARGRVLARLVALSGH